MAERDKLSTALTVGAAGALVAYAILLNFETVYIEQQTALASWLIIGLGMRQVSLRAHRREP